MKNILKDLHGKRVMITGASSGIGQATSLLLHEMGAQVVLVGRSEQRLSETAKMLDRHDHKLLLKDLSKVDEIPTWMREFSVSSGTLDGLVHCAGVHDVNPVRFLKDKSFSDLMNINVNSSLQLAKGFRQRGVRGKSGSIVFIASVVGLVGRPGVVAYSASKGAVCALTRSIALEFASENIRVNSVAPGLVNTKMTKDLNKKLSAEQLTQLQNEYPLGVGEPEDVAHSIAFLLSTASRWITGTILTVDGGYTAQ